MAPHQWGELHKLVTEVAREVARKWPDTIEPDDVAQDVMVILLESPASARAVLDADSRIAKQMIWKLGHREASKEMDAYEYFSGQYHYSIDEVRGLLEAGVLTRDLQGYPEETLDLVDALVTMQWERSAYVDPILGRYVDGEVPERGSAEARRLNRGVESVAKHMYRNRRRRETDRESGPGSRKALSNARASHLVGA